MSEPSHRRTVLPILVGVLAVVVLAEVGARLVMTQTTDAIRWYDATAQLKVEQMGVRGEVDVVFAGTSMAQQAFVPSVFTEATGQTAWNAGLAGGTPEVMSPWLLEEVVPRLQPSTVVWGLSSFDLAPAYGPAQAEVYDEALETRDGWLAAADRAVSSGSVLVRNRAVLRSLDALAGAAAHERGVAHAEAERITGSDGERTEQAADVGEQRGRIVAARLADFTPHQADLDLIATTVRSLEADGIDVILVQLPVPDRFRDAHPNGNADHALVGPALAVANLELRTSPISYWFLKSGATVFYDVGHAANSIGELRAYHNVGIGIRSLIPQFGRELLRIDWAIPLNGPTSGFPGRISAGYTQAF